VGELDVGLVREGVSCLDQGAEGRDRRGLDIVEPGDRVRVATGSPTRVVGMSAALSSGVPMSTRARANLPVLSRMISIRLIPPSVWTATVSPSSSPDSSRNLAKTRTPFPHISASDPSAL
jgi:hypothetical protein